MELSALEVSQTRALRNQVAHAKRSGVPVLQVVDPPDKFVRLA
jgi:hypothetical protein